MGNPKYQRFFALIDDYVHSRLSHSEELEMKRAMKESKMLTQSVAEAWKTKEVAEAEAKIRGERIKAKLSGELTAQQENQFSKDLEEDPLLKEDLDLEDQVDEGFRQLRYQKFKAEADRWKEELPLSDDEVQGSTHSPLSVVAGPAINGKLLSPENVKSRINRRWFAIAASLILLVVAGFLLTPYFLTDNTALAARESFTMPAFNGVRGKGTENTNYDTGLADFRSGQYSKALTELQKVEEGDPNYEEAQLLIGLVGLELPEVSGLPNLLNLYQRNVKTLDLDLAVGTGLDMRALSTKDVEWYLVLSYFEAGRKREGGLLLESIIADVEHPFYDEAKALKKEVE